MIEITELRLWLDTLQPDSFVGIDEGGLTLVEMNGSEETGASYEIGGLPEETEAD